MKIFLPFILVPAIACLCGVRPAEKKEQTVNPLLGDISWAATYGQAPVTGEVTRVQTHLLYAEALVRRNTAGMSNAAIREKRNRLMDMLHQYAMAAAYPKNYDYTDERKPCFIDRDGNICAVGYLVAQTAGRPAAEIINTAHQYETIEEMKDEPMLQAWVVQSGLTLEECAIIQPTYGPVPNPSTTSGQSISKNYAISTSISAGMNLAFNAVNHYQIKNGAKSKLVPLLGLATGAFSVINGIRNFPGDPVQQNPWEPLPEPNNAKKLMSIGNITLGTFTMALSTWNLLKNRKKPEQKTSWNLFSQPGINGRMAYGCSLNKRIG